MFKRFGACAGAAGVFAALIVAAIVTMAAPTTASAAAVLFTTQEDFAEWNTTGTPNMALTGVAAGSTDSSTTNGLGNTLAAGGAGTSGSLSAQWNAGSFNYMFGPGEQANAAFLAELGTTADATAGPTTGIISFDHTQPPPGTGNYFQLGMVLNYNDNFGQFFGTTADNGNGTFTTTVPYTINAHPALTYFQLGLIYNSNHDTNTPFTIDNIQTVPEPAALALSSLLPGLALARRRRRR
jgi:hypothetical protein